MGMTMASPAQSGHRPEIQTETLEPLAGGGWPQLAFTCGKFTVGGCASDPVLVLPARDGKSASDLIGMIQGNIDSTTSGPK